LHHLGAILVNSLAIPHWSETSTSLHSLVSVVRQSAFTKIAAVDLTEWADADECNKFPFQRSIQVCFISLVRVCGEQGGKAIVNNNI
jgi:hypothetical protein